MIIIINLSHLKASYAHLHMYGRHMHQPYMLVNHYVVLTLLWNPNECKSVPAIDSWPCATLQAKIQMYSRYEMQKDGRSYGDRHTFFQGPTWRDDVKRITPCRIVKWDEDTGLPIYEDIPGAQHHEDIEEEEWCQVDVTSSACCYVPKGVPSILETSSPTPYKCLPPPQIDQVSSIGKILCTASWFMALGAVLIVLSDLGGWLITYIALNYHFHIISG